MDLLTDVIKYLMDKAGPLAVVLMMVIWWGYKLLLRKEEIIAEMGETISGMTNQLAEGRVTDMKFITLLEQLIYGRLNGKI